MSGGEDRRSRKVFRDGGTLESAPGSSGPVGEGERETLSTTRLGVLGWGGPLPLDSRVVQCSATALRVSYRAGEGDWGDGHGSGGGRTDPRVVQSPGTVLGL